VKEEGAAKVQFIRVVTPGKIGQRSAEASSQTLMTY